MRLIDADALMDKSYETGRWMPVRVVNVEDIDAAPTIDAEPVRHGRWIHYDGNQFRCSNCRQLEYIPRPCWRLKDYCPNCGAKMDLEVQDD